MVFAMRTEEQNKKHAEYMSNYKKDDSVYQQHKKDYAKKYYQENKERIKKNSLENHFKNRDQRLIRQKEYRVNNREKELCRKRLLYHNNKEVYQKKNKLNYEKHKEKYNKASYLRKKERLKTDIAFRIKDCLSSRVRQAIKHRYDGVFTSDLIGCDIDFLRQQLENKFQPGMSWDNYGLKGWNIDHIIPCSSFNLGDFEEQKICFNWANLQPMWSGENLDKGIRIKCNPITEKELTMCMTLFL